LVAEVCYFLGRVAGPRAEAGFTEALADEDFELAGLSPAVWRRVADLVLQYADLPLGSVDASVIAVAERLDATDVASFDCRHFAAVRPRHVTALTLLPDPLPQMTGRHPSAQVGCLAGGLAVPSAR
jgi:hypothetical protein